ncbi:hypothetical protein ACQCVP_22685 [Rossellomorea vietnamensis]|uniref:hypothetical protein n=1 Tax=Rossellomorea vietnamensis TaxID=218284 RepID=UPI003CF4247C
MDITREIKELEESIDTLSIDLTESNLLHTPIRLVYFELKGYSELVIKLNREKSSCTSYEEKENLIDSYKRVYLSERKIYQRILSNLNNGNLMIHYGKSNDDYLYDVLERFININREKTLDENLMNYLKVKLKGKISEANQQLYILKNYPVEYINSLSTFIGPGSVLKYKSDLIIYKDVTIAASTSNSFSVYYNENTDEGTKNALLNIMAYFNGQPSFYFTENYDFNRKLCDLYEQFDLLDTLRLRKKNFFDSKQKEPFFLELPILKQKNNYNIVAFEASQNEMIFELYHASLKQFESLPRCVFLYRVFEYGVTHHYKPIMRPVDYKPEDALIYYVNEIMSHKFNPLYYLDSGTYINEEGTKVSRKRKAKYVNFITKLKEEAKEIQKQWKNNPYLRNKSVGKTIYVTGRNAAAHGGSGRGNARYDYSMNYKHINDVNIFLELIARFLIEKLNPQLSNMVERRKKFYIKYNNYEKIFEQEKD